MAKSISPLLQTTLKNSGYSLTLPRQTVFRALQNQPPQTMREIIKNCNAVDRASVYRTIALFEKLGIVQRLQIGWKYKLELSDAFSYHHHHLACTSCDEVIALPEDKKLEGQINKLARSLDFLPQGHQLEIRGRCAACQQNG